MKRNVFAESVRAAASKANPVSECYASGAVVVELSKGFYGFPCAALGIDLAQRMAAWAAKTPLSAYCEKCGDSMRWVLPDGTRPCHCAGIPAPVALSVRALAECRKEGVAW